MKDKLEVEMYVRTNEGIGTVQRIYNNKNDCTVKFKKGYVKKWVTIFSASYNIIELIRVGDYVNGKLVVGFDEDNLGEKYIKCGYNDDKYGEVSIRDKFYEEDIKSIVTKEQFKAMEYKIEEGLNEQYNRTGAWETEINLPFYRRQERQIQENKLKVGMYAYSEHSRDYGIGKIVKIHTNGFTHQEIEIQYKDIKISTRYDYVVGDNNIIELIRVGDYVNGMLVVGIENDNSDEKYIQCGYISKSQDVWVTETFYAEEIENIVTKEQFKANSYKIEEGTNEK